MSSIYFVVRTSIDLSILKQILDISIGSESVLKNVRGAPFALFPFIYKSNFLRFVFRIISTLIQLPS